MSTTKDQHGRHEIGETAEEFLTGRYREEIGRLAQLYPNDRKSLVVDFNDELYEANPDLADDALDRPEFILDVLEETMRNLEATKEVDVAGAHVRLANLPDHWTYYPGEFSPSEHRGKLRALEGEIAKATNDYARMEVAAFECQRCGTLTRIPQVDGEFQSPHECQGCERQGPFRINYDQSEFVDAQKLRLQTPPEEAQGEGADIDVFVEDDYADIVTAGDRVTVTGIVRLEQQSSGNAPKNKFDPYVEGVHVEVDQTDARDVDATQEEREEIEAYAHAEEGEPLDLAAESLAPKIHGYHDVKKAIILALVGGARTEYEGDDFDRGEFHVLLIGDPSTAKSKLVQRAEQVGWRTVGVSGKGATVAGVTATAVQDDFGDGSWSLDAGAAVKAHRGVLTIDELDDMPPEVRSALLEPMSKQTIHVTKGGVNTHLETRAAVVAAANPENGRYDPYTPPAQQFNLSSTLLSRFDLVYTFKDVPDETDDADIGGHILDARDAAKREERGEATDTDAHTGPISPSLLRKWIALAKQQPKPVFASADVRDSVLERFTTFRGLHDYNEDDPVPVTFRSLEGIVRVAEAAAKFEFSETIEQRHVDIASDLVGKSMQDIGKDPETGEFDADVKESGTSKSQRDRRERVIETIKDCQSDSDSDEADRETVLDALEEDGFDRGQVDHDITTLKEKDGVVIEPRSGYLKYIGKW